jgi:CDP-diacylglycerol--serine O-phosphatidyltransferase
VREFLNAANLLTSGSLAAGVAALMLAGDGLLPWALAAVGVAAVLDSVDGCVARRTSVCGPFGGHLDSLADLTAFGVAPAVILHHGALRGEPVLGGGVCVAFVVAGAWRLARFGLVEDRRRFAGLPIPPAGLIAAAAGIGSLAPGAAAVLVLVLALLMVSSFGVPTLPELARYLSASRTRWTEASTDSSAARSRTSGSAGGS